MEKRLLQIFWSGKVRGSAERYNSGSYTVTSKLVLTKRIFSCQLTLSQLFLLHISFASLALRNTETQLHTVFTAGDPQITSCSITSEHYLEASGGKQQINIWVTEWVNTFTRSLLYFTQSSKFKILFSKIHFQHLVWLPFSKEEWQLLEKMAQSDKQSVKKGQLQLNSSISHHTVMETTLAEDQQLLSDPCGGCWVGYLMVQSSCFNLLLVPPPRTPIVFAEKRKMHQTHRDHLLWEECTDVEAKLGILAGEMRYGDTDCMKARRSFQVWKGKPMHMCLWPAAFLTASRGQILRLWKDGVIFFLRLFCFCRSIHRNLFYIIKKSVDFCTLSIYSSIFSILLSSGSFWSPDLKAPETLCPYNNLFLRLVFKTNMETHQALRFLWSWQCGHTVQIYNYYDELCR